MILGIGEVSLSATGPEAHYPNRQSNHTEQGNKTMINENPLHAAFRNQHHRSNVRNYLVGLDLEQVQDYLDMHVERLAAACPPVQFPSDHLTEASIVNYKATVHFTRQYIKDVRDQAAQDLFNKALKNGQVVN